MKLKLFIGILAIFLLISCSSEEDTESRTEIPGFITEISIPDSVKQNQEFQISFETQLNGCDDFSRIRIKENSDTIFLNVYFWEVTPSSGVVCPAAIFPYSDSFVYRIPQAGEYYFQLNLSEYFRADKDTIITIMVLSE